MIDTGNMRLSEIVEELNRLAALYGNYEPLVDGYPIASISLDREGVIVITRDLGFEYQDN
jgi:hypothetical protein